MTNTVAAHTNFQRANFNRSCRSSWWVGPTSVSCGICRTACLVPPASHHYLRKRHKLWLVIRKISLTEQQFGLIMALCVCRMWSGVTLGLRDVMGKRAHYGSGRKGPTRRATRTPTGTTWYCRWRDGETERLIRSYWQEWTILVQFQVVKYHLNVWQSLCLYSVNVLRFVFFCFCLLHLSGS